MSQYLSQYEKPMKISGWHRSALALMAIMANGLWLSVSYQWYL